MKSIGPRDFWKPSEREGDREEIKLFKQTPKHTYIEKTKIYKNEPNK